MSEEQAKANIVALRKQTKKPEDITEYDLNNTLSSITEKSLDKYIQEQELFKYKAQKNEEEIEILKRELQTQKLELDKYRSDEKKKSDKREKRNLFFSKVLTFFRKILIIAITCIIIAVGILIYIYNYKVLGIVIDIVGIFVLIFEILKFFKIDFLNIKSWMNKKTK